MKPTTGLITACLLFVATASAQSPFGSLEDKASEVVTVTLNAETLKLLARFADDDHDMRDMTRALNGVTEIRVHALQFRSSGKPTDAEISEIRKRFTPDKWTPFLNVRSKSDHENVDAFTGATGMAILVSDAHEVVLVELTGKASASQLMGMSHHFGLPELELTKPGDVQRLPPPKPESSAHKPEARRDFKHLIHTVENQYGVQKTWLPMWLVKPAAYFGSGGTTSGLNLAVFEKPTEAMRRQNGGFHDTIAKALPDGWTPFVEVREGDGEHLTRIWLGGANRNVRLLIATMDGNDAVLLTLRQSLRDLDKGPFMWGSQAKRNMH